MSLHLNLAALLMALVPHDSGDNNYGGPEVPITVTT